MGMKESTHQDREGRGEYTLVNCCDAMHTSFKRKTEGEMLAVLTLQNSWLSEYLMVARPLKLAGANATGRRMAWVASERASLFI